MLNEIKTQGGKVTLYTERPKSKYSYTLICTDIDVDDDVQTLTLISNSHEIEADYVMYDFRSVKKQFPNVETLVITEMVIDVYVSNMMFPNLKQVVSKNKTHLSGGMLARKCNDGQAILQNVFCHSKDYVIDMAGITKIEDYAFDGCQSENIINKTCHHCGYKNDDLQLSERIYVCPVCGNIMPRDKNAAINILEEGLRILKENIFRPSVEGYSKPALITTIA